MNAMRIRDIYLPHFGKNWLWFLGWGIALVILGVFAVGAAAFTTLISVILIGILLIVSGAIILGDSLTFWRGTHPTYLLHVLLAALYVLIGIIILMNPVQSSLSITLFLGVFYLIIGLFRMAFAALSKLPNWGWAFFNGIVTFLLGVLIVSNWPVSGLVVIGLFIGIDFIFTGLSYIMYALAGRRTLRLPAA